MNELERLISAVPHPEPSELLDHRVSALFSEQRSPRPHPRLPIALAWCATAACVGLIGFYSGRWSAAAAPGATVLTTIPQAATGLAQSAPSSSTIHKIPLRQDQLASLFVQPTTPVAMFGNGAVKIEVSMSP